MLKVDTSRMAQHIVPAAGSFVDRPMARRALRSPVIANLRRQSAYSLQKELYESNNKDLSPRGSARLKGRAYRSLNSVDGAPFRSFNSINDLGNESGGMPVGIDYAPLMVIPPGRGCSTRNMDRIGEHPPALAGLTS